MKLYILSLLIFCGFGVKAQNFPVYKPIGESRQETAKENEQSQIVEAYLMNDINKSVSKIKLKIEVTDMGIVIKSYRALGDTYWTLTTGIARKLSSWDPESKRFEYKGNIPAVGNIYF